MADKVVLDSEDIRRTLVRIAHEIVERTAGEDLAIVGIHRRGAVLANRLHALVQDLLPDAPVPLGDIDISFYRDDIDEVTISAGDPPPDDWQPIAPDTRKERV